LLPVLVLGSSILALVLMPAVFILALLINISDRFSFISYYLQLCCCTNYCKIISMFNFISMFLLTTTTTVVKNSVQHSSTSAFLKKTVSTVRHYNEFIT